MNICKNCKHYNYNVFEVWSDQKHQCKRSNSVISIVTGELIEQIRFCGDERFSEDEDCCGHEGKFYEEKQA